MHICFLNFVFPDSKHQESQVEKRQLGGVEIYLRLAYRNATFKFTGELKHPSFVISVSPQNSADRMYELSCLTHSQPCLNYHK